MTTDELISQINAIQTPDDIERVRALIPAGLMEQAVKDALLAKLDQVTAQSTQFVNEVATVLRIHGVDYPLTDWLTPKKYAERFGVANVETVLNWINRGIIPADHVKEVPELGLRLVKAVEYSPRAYAGRTKDA